MEGPVRPLSAYLIKHRGESAATALATVRAFRERDLPGDEVAVHLAAYEQRVRPPSS